MKLFSLLLICILVTYSVAFDFESIDTSNFPALSEETVNQFGRIFSVLFLKRLEAVEFELPTPRIPVLPPLPDVFQFPDISIHIANDTGISDLFFGDIQTCYANVSGLSTVGDDLTFNITTSPSKISYTLKADNISLDGLHEVSIYFLPAIEENPNRFNMTSREDFFIKIFNFMLELRVDVHLFGLINVTNVEVDLDEDIFEFGLFFNNAIIEYFNEDVPTKYEMTEAAWKSVSTGLNGLFRQLWKNPLERNVSVAVTKALHNLLKDCTVPLLLNKKYECLNLPGLMSMDEMLAADIGNFVRNSEEPAICPVKEKDPGGTTPPTGTEGTTNAPSKGADAIAKSNIVISSILLLFVKFYLI